MITERTSVRRPTAGLILSLCGIFVAVAIIWSDIAKTEPERMLAAFLLLLGLALFFGCLMIIALIYMQRWALKSIRTSDRNSELARRIREQARTPNRG